MIGRPQSLFEIPGLTTDLMSFGMNVRDFIGVFSAARRSGDKLQLLLEREPARMAGLFTDGNVGDAFLGGLAEYFSRASNLDIPPWAMSSLRTLSYRWYPVEIDELKKHIDKVALHEFRWRNILIDESAFQRL